MEFIKNTDQKAAIIFLGKVLQNIVQNEKWPGYNCGIEKEEFLHFKESIKKAEINNPWFTSNMVEICLTNWAENLNESIVNQWLNNYKDLNKINSKTILIICAGNLPLVGWHDILCCILLGHNIQVKLSSNDEILIPAILHLISLFYPSINEQVKIIKNKPTNFDYVIATGSDNSNRYFEYYFGHVPSLFRKNRTSIAVLDDSVSEDELLKLSDDIFNYYGLGCRSVTKLYLPFNFDLDRLFNAFYKHKELINHNKYMNNYDYNRSIFLLQKITFLENGFLILKEDENLFSPVSVVHYEFYKDLNQLNSTLKHQTEKIQCRVGTGGIPFGKAQQPKIWDYADGVDTIDFLTKI